MIGAGIMAWEYPQARASQTGVATGHDDQSRRSGVSKFGSGVARMADAV
jgi:hypothetical protein